MKKRFLLIAFLVLTMFLFACSEDLLINDSPENKRSDLNDNEADVSGEITGDSHWDGYSGYNNGGKAYCYLYEEGRNRRWEEIVLELADDFLSPYDGHPYLSDRRIGNYIVDKNFTKHVVGTINVFDKEKQSIFIRHINKIIFNIRNWTDTELLLSLKAAIAMIDEPHTLLFISSLNTYPYRFFSLRSGEEHNVYCMVAPKEYPNLPGSRLKSINGLDVSEIMVRLSRYAFPNEIYESNMISQIVTLHNLLYPWEVLQVINVVGVNDDEIVFVFEDEKGKNIQVNTQKTSKMMMNECLEPERVVTIFNRFPVPFHMKKSETLWYDIIDDDILYIRIASFFTDEFKEFLLAVKKTFEEMKQCTKIVLDLRYNRGGYYNSSLCNYIHNMDAERVFVFTNELSQSSSVITAQALRRFCPNVTLVGSGRAHLNFLFSPQKTIMDNVPGYEQLEYYIPCNAIQTSENTDWISGSTELFSPDVLLYFEYEDFIEGRDTFLEWVKNQ